MANNLDQENIADGLVTSASFKAPSLSPKKSSRRTRSKSIGPGGLAASEEHALKESSGNRRKSAFVPAVKSILSSNDEDEKKRREARRKSLARRRVSFAPEATLHTWDVVEYLRDATTSSASSEASRRASNVSQASPQKSRASGSDTEEPPSTPPEQIEEIEELVGSSPASQRDLHQKKHRRRSSGIPPMNFNNPDDVFSSSPLSADNQSPDKGDTHDHSSSDEEAVEGPESAIETNDSESSARLDAALREAAAHASTQRVDMDEKRNFPVEVAEDEITASFKPWTKKHIGTPDHENDAFSGLEGVDPMSPSIPHAATPEADDDGDEMSMDITRAMGRIVQQPSSDSDDMTMDLTMPLGSIQQAANKDAGNRRKSLKRHRSSLMETSQGSPAKRPASRRTSLRQRAQTEESVVDDVTMDLTVAIGAIKSDSTPRPFTRRHSGDTSFGDETMEFTVAVGSIQSSLSVNDSANLHDDQDEDEDLSMEFTNVIGGIKNLNKPSATPERPMPVTSASPATQKTRTPSKSPRKSPGQLKSTTSKVVQSSISPRVVAARTPQRSPGRPRKTVGPFTPEPNHIAADKPIGTEVDAAEGVATPASKARNNISRIIPEDPIAAPILNRRRSSLSLVQFSPLAVAREEQVLKSSASLINNIKLLSTPRKQSLASPMKRILTPKQSRTPQKASTPRQKTPTPKKPTPRKSLSPRKRVAFGEEPTNDDQQQPRIGETAEEEVERISLQDFLEMTKIRFMDLNTTKRRHTAAPAAFHDAEIEETEESLDRYVIAGACTLPEYELYQHACHEMKKYISDGRHFVRTMEANVLEENPLLFSEYLTAPPDQRVVMDNQFKNLKTNARLEARGEWYGWRSTLLQDLKVGLLGTMEGFKKDEAVLSKQESLLDAVLPSLIDQHKQLTTESQHLQQRHDELNSCDREELELVREQLVATDTELAERRELLEQLKAELTDKATHIEAVKQRKLECTEEIRVAELVREECRGWSTQEVHDLRDKVTALEKAHGWSITSATAATVTMTHLNDLELYFQPSAFATGESTPNASISLTYVGDSASPHPRPLTTSKRFFLQLIRAHLHCIPQAQTRISDVLRLVQSSWATALAVAEGVRWLEHNAVTEEFILSDERMAISTHMLLHAVQTKVRVTFELGVSVNDGTHGVDAHVDARAELVYGEKYSEDKMGAFLRDFCGDKVRDAAEMSVWANAVVDLAARLKATGRKGERAH